MKGFSVVRVYSKSLEWNAFPIPRTIEVSRKCLVLPDEVEHTQPPETVLLHKLIRDEKCPLHESICRMDKRIEADARGDTISDKELGEYRRQTSAAEKHVLTKADVILCTCTESASERIRKATNIQQVYIPNISLPVGLYTDGHIACLSYVSGCWITEPGSEPKIWSVSG